MKVAALYDIHGNLPALEAVLQEAAGLGVDKIVVGGDVGPGPMVNACLDLLLSLGSTTFFLRGNGDDELLDLKRGGEGGRIPERFRESARWAANGLESRHVQFMESWPSTVSIHHPEVGEALFCHATPRNNLEIFTKETSAQVLPPVFEGVSAQVVVCGHTHMQFERKVGNVLIVNAGSVGMPFGDPGAYWLLIESAPQLMKTEYDYHAAANRIRASGYPMAEEFAESNVLNPPSEAEMLQRFATVEIGQR